MRVRLLTTVLSLIVLVLLGLGIPLATTVASSQQQRLFLDRLTDASRFASLAQRPLSDNQAALIGPELRRYQDVHQIEVAVVDRDHRVFAASAAAFPLTDDAVASAVNLALAGRRSEPGALLLPWDAKPLVLAEPILVDGEVRGAVVSISPTDRTRLSVLLSWVVLATGSVLVLGLAVLLALPVVRWILHPVRRLDNATGRVVAAVVSGEPVIPVGGDSGPPELRRLTRDFDQMAATVGDALAAQRAFVADASHQLRNPLTALRLRLGNLEGMIAPEAEPDQRAAVEETDRLNRILDELLALARAESSALDPVPIQVDAVVAERVANWQVVGDVRSIELVVTGETGVFALMPPRSLEGVLDALIDNALKFSPEVSIVNVDIRTSGKSVTIAVRDHGPGLEPAELDRATDRFWRSPIHQNVRGSGLGLAIVRLVMERAGGSIALDLPEGGGLRVTLTLSVAEGGVEHVAQRAAIEPPAQVIGEDPGDEGVLRGDVRG